MEREKVQERERRKKSFFSTKIFFSNICSAGFRESRPPVYIITNKNLNSVFVFT